MDVPSPALTYARKLQSDGERSGDHEILVGNCRPDNSNDLPNNTRRDEAIEKQLNLTPSCHSVFKYLILSLFGVVAVKYQAKSEDPSETHRLQTWSFLAATIIYSLLLLALKQLQIHRHKYVEILRGVAFASGVLSIFSLLSLLLPYYPGLVLLKASWALSTTIAAWPLLRSTYHWLLNGIKTLLSVLISLGRNLLTPWNFSQQESPMPSVPGSPV